MKRLLLILTFLNSSWILLSQVQTITYSISPETVEEDNEVTITIDGASIDESLWGITDHSLYIWAWSYDLTDSNPLDCPTNGTWDNSSESNKLVYNSSDDTYLISFIPQDFFNRVGIGKFGFLIKAKDGTGDKKSQDIYVEVGTFYITYLSPAHNSITGVEMNGSQTVLAAINSGSALYELYANDTLLDSDTTSGTYNYSISNITQNLYCTLDITQDDGTISFSFIIVVNQGELLETMPDNLLDGINYESNDTSKATLVLSAPLKDFIYVSGSFNNWQPDIGHAMKKDPSTGKYWLEIDGLLSQEIYTYQYWVFETTPIANSPKVVKTADPYSTLVLSPFDDPYIPSTSYPNMPEYPWGQEREVTVLQTDQTPYNWQVTNFTKPKKEDLIIYEILIRDFDENRTFQNLIDRIDYFKDLNINAIELMPVMEFEGNESWGYNPAFHMALDKFYGPANKLKELVDLCHQNDIAVILDVALNHAFGRNPMNRMWMVDDDNDGWGEPSSESPYFNEEATHSYSVGSDFNHSQTITQEYTKRVVKHWIEEFKIDGFRWDLTKGFTQNCSSGDETCTNAYQQDRVDILKDYADYSWSIDPTHCVIFEHLGTDAEEQEWANYHIGEGKGVMMWGKMTDQYNQLTMGYASNSNFDRMGHTSHGFSEKRVLGYAESHDEERLMYKNIQYGNDTNPNHNVTELDIALSRMSALGAVTLIIPGPKMIWHFGDLGMDNSIYTCTDGSVDTNCKLSTKPQPQWVENWLGDADRYQIYQDWAKLIVLKQYEDVFEGEYSIDSGNLTPRIYIWDDDIPASELKNVVVLANFDVTIQNVTPDFPYTGIWHNLMDNTTIAVSNTADQITLGPGEFRIYGNQSSVAGVSDHDISEVVQIYPNPVLTSFQINKSCNNVSIYDVRGKLARIHQGEFDNNSIFSVRELKSGLYFVKITTNNGVAIKKVLVK